MYVDHYRKDFYELLLGHRVLIIAGYDVDSVCSTKILQYLLRIDENPYIVICVSGVQELKAKFNDYRNIRRVVLINCGGSLDVMDLFDNPTDVVIFIIDSHRPTHILNIYNENKQVRIVTPAEDNEDIPAFDDIFRVDQEILESDESSEEDEELEEEDEGAGPSPGGKRKRGVERRAELVQKRKDRRDWEINRNKVIFNYTKHNYYGVPSSLIALEVAWSKSIGDSEIVWWSIVGLTEHFIQHRMDRPHYTLLVSQLQNHVARIQHESTSSLSCLKISFENELYLFLYRHWNLYASMKATPAWRCKFRLWSCKGTQRLHAYLAEVGLPLKEVRQTFCAMNYSLRQDLKTILCKKADKYDLLEDMSFGSFFAQYGYVYKFSAMDHYLSVLALLEEPGEKTLGTRFFNALQCLCKTKKSLLMEGIEVAKQIIGGMISQVQIFLDVKQIIVTNDLLYTVIQYGSLDSKYFANPGCLNLLAHHTLQAFISSSPHGKNMRELPLIMMVPKTLSTHYVIGIPPIATNLTHNLFGKAFESIAKKMTDVLMLDLFETNIGIIQTTEIEKFLEMIMNLLA